MLTLSVGRIIADRAPLAVFMVVYDNPCHASSLRNPALYLKVDCMN